MSQPVDITTGVQTVSTAGAVTGTLDTSGFTGDYTIHLRIPSLAAGKRALIVIEDTASASAFSDARQIATEHVVGLATQDVEQRFSWRAHKIQMTRYGAANTKLRVNVIAVDATPGLKVHAYLTK